MTAQLLTSELSNLIQESKRKHNDLRQASEKSLDELKNLRDTSEPYIGAELSQHASFVNPFIIACGTRNVKFTSIAIVCLQRLIAAKGIPRSRLDQVLQAIREASSGGLDVQLRILQSLPSLLQNYVGAITGDLLTTAINICFVLQASKNVVVNNTASATLQQLLISVFDNVSAEDEAKLQKPPAGEAPVQGGTVPLHAAALDAFHVFNDICLLTESARPEFLRFSSLPQTFGLELIESVLTNHPVIFATHPEQTHILRIRVMPYLIESLSGKPNFPTAVRLVRVLYTVLRRHMSLLVTECGEGLAALSQVLDQDGHLWKRVLCMEAFKGIFSEPNLLRQIYMLYDAKEDEKNILQDLLATFVRVSTERPSVIGLGHQSTIPVAGPNGTSGSVPDEAVLEASGVTGIISGSVTAEGSSTGISSQWSSIRTPCIDQFDKSEPLPIPDSYIFSLILACITSLSEGLAKFILPLTVPSESRNRKRSLRQDGRPSSPAPAASVKDEATLSAPSLERSSSFKKNPVPLNPLLLKNHPLHAEVQAYADMIDRCWPAILATCSTFLYSALDSEYYHSLVRAFQRFTHVAGLLQLNTPRDAFLTTLGKAAVPPNVLTACLNAGARPSTPTSTASGDGPNNSIFSNARGLLSVDSLVSQNSNSEKTRQPSADPVSAALNTRNLLCLRALLNLGIALGPTLESSWQIVLETLQQADFVLFCSGKVAGRTPTAAKAVDRQAESEASQLLANFGSEIKAVETAASRLFESTVDFPNASFVEFVVAICSLLEKRSGPDTSRGDSRPQTPTTPDAPTAGSGSLLKTPVVKHKRVMSITTAPVSGPSQEDQFVLAKLGDVASINLERLLYYPPDVSGWEPLTTEISNALSSTTTSAAVRMRAAETLVRLILEGTAAVATAKEDTRSSVQLRLLETLRDALVPMQRPDRGSSFSTLATDVDIHKAILDGLKGLLEESGEALVSGWDVVFEIIGTIFVEPEQATQGAPEDMADRILVTRSVRLIKSSFGSLQLICSDFLASLPNACYLNLVDTLYKFCSQDDDLNVALTTVTFYWAISDFLLSRSNPISITDAIEGGASEAALVKLAYNTAHPGSGAALWMLLLLRLTAVTTDQRLELRNSAVQTLLRIIHAYGSSLNAEAWSICIRSVIFKLLSSTEDRLQGAAVKGARGGKGGGGALSSEWNETAVVIINGVSELLANYLDVLVSHAVFSSLWEELLDHFARMLDFKALDVNTAVFGSLAGILSKNGGRARWTLDAKAVELAWRLWSRGVPISEAGPVELAQAETGRDKKAKVEDNQKCLVSWVNAFLEIERLMRADMDLAKTQRMIALLHEAMVQASAGSYASDIEYMTPLQGRILEVFKIVRTDMRGAPSAMIAQLARFASMAFDLAETSPSQKRTFVAMSKASMPILHHHITHNTSDAEIFSSGAFAAALAALAKPIGLKYRFPITTKGQQPWKEAVQAVLAVLEATLPHLREKTVPRAAFQKAWDVVVAVSNGILDADLSEVALDDSVIAVDQAFDIAAFRKLRELIVPALGSAAVAEHTRQAYAEGLFRISIVHPAEEGHATVLGGGDDKDSKDGLAGALQRLYEPGRGRTTDPPPTKRAEMSYVCLDELFALVAAHDAASAPPTIEVLPPTPRFPNKSMAAAAAAPPVPVGGAGDGDLEHSRYVRLAQTAAPFLIVRCALALQAYAADQPLRGHMPQPLAQRRELGRILRSLVDLQSEPEAIPALEGGGGAVLGSAGASRKHLLRLYPLLVRASQVAGAAGDGVTLGLVGEALEAVGGGLGCP